MFDYATIIANWETYPAIRLYYHYHDESGWARRLDARHVCLANVPFSGGKKYRDIVTLTRRRHGLPCIAKIIQHYYCWQWCVAYVEPAEVDDTALFDAAWATLRDTCEAAGCAIAAGPDPGLAVVNAPEDVDLRALLEPLGLVGDAMLLFQPDAATRT